MQLYVARTSLGRCVPTVNRVLPLTTQKAFSLRKLMTSPTQPATHHVEAMQQRGCSNVATHAAETEVQAETAAETLPEIVKMDIRVGKILSCEKHPDADSLYVEKIDVGEEEPRTIVSGLVKYVPQEELQDRKVIVLCNLKARNMRGIKSHGMLLCASNDAHNVVEPLTPPEEAQIGERVYFGEIAEQPEPAKENQVQKKKVWETVQPDLKTTGDKVAAFQGMLMTTSAGPVTTATLANGNIS